MVIVHFTLHKCIRPELVTQQNLRLLACTFHKVLIIEGVSLLLRMYCICVKFGIQITVDT